MIHFFEKVKGTYKNRKFQLLKIDRSVYVILINLYKGPRTNFQSPTLSQKHGRSVSHTAH